MNKKRVVVITGSAGQLGKAVTQRFLQGQDRLALFVHHSEQVDILQKEWKDFMERIHVSCVEMTNPSAVFEAVENVQKHFGQIDVVIHTVGGFQAAPFLKTSLDDWRALIEQNATSAFLCAQATLPFLIKQKQGHMIFIGSHAALHGSEGISAYAASKAALLRMIESLAAEYIEAGIRVNAILPSTMDTPQNRKNMPKANFATWVSPHSIAQVIHFLASVEANDINGAAIPVGRL